MKKATYGIFLCLILASLLFTGCFKKPPIDYTSTYRMSGEWWTVYYYSGTALTAPHKLITYNTSDAGSGKVWVDDPNIWTFKAKSSIDYSSLSFTSSTGTNDYAPAFTVKFYEGKVIPMGGHSKTGNPVDSIYLKVEFSDDPGNIYEIKGHARTGFFEDEY